MNDREYILEPADKSMVLTAKELLWKIARSELATIAQLEQIVRVLVFLDRLPAAGEDLAVIIQLTGPRRRYGDHEIYHWWDVRVEDQTVGVESGGYFYRPSTGGDSFTCMMWSASPGMEAEFRDFLGRLKIVDDAMPLASEVRKIDLREAGYKLLIYADLEEVDNRGKERLIDRIVCPNEFLPPDDAQEQLLAEQASFDKGLHMKIVHSNPPEICNLCGTDLSHRNLFVDGQIRGDMMWANMCSGCFFLCGEGIGWGEGQLYAKTTDGEWVLVGGFNPQQ